MEALEIGPSALASAAKSTRQDILRWRDQERRLTPEWATRLAPHLETSAAALLLLPEGASGVPKSAELLEIQNLSVRLPPHEIDDAIAALIEQRDAANQLEVAPAPKAKRKATLK